MTSANSNFLPKFPSPNNIRLGIRVPTYELGGGRYKYIIQSNSDQSLDFREGKCDWYSLGPVPSLAKRWDEHLF